MAIQLNPPYNRKGIAISLTLRRRKMNCYFQTYVIF